MRGARRRTPPARWRRFDRGGFAVAANGRHNRLAGQPFALAPRYMGNGCAARHRRAVCPFAGASRRAAARLKSLPGDGFVGANLTIPHKETRLLLCDVLAESARRAGAVNTLEFRDGKIIGSNTDGAGFSPICARAG